MFERFMSWIGFGLCHQLPERSFFGGGVQVPVCARDTGIYAGVIISLAVLAILHRGTRPSGLPRPRVWVVIGVLTAFMLWDGATSYAGIRPTTNLLRLSSGLCAGYAVGALLLPLLNEQLWRYPGRERVLESSGGLLVWLASIPVFGALFWYVGPLVGVYYPALVAFAIVASLAAINLVIVSMLPWFERRAVRWFDLVAPCAIAAVISFIEIGLAGVMRSTLFAAARFLGT